MNKRWEMVATQETDTNEMQWPSVQRAIDHSDPQGWSPIKTNFKRMTTLYVRLKNMENESVY